MYSAKILYCAFATFMSTVLVHAQEAPSASPTCENEKLGKICGDPHLRTWSGHKYDWHRICDAVLLHNPEYEDGLGLTIQVRTKPIPGTAASFMESVAVRIGSETLEVKAGSEHQAWLNGEKDSTLEETGKATIAGNSITYDHFDATMNSRRYLIQLHNKAWIKITTWKYFANVNVYQGDGDEFVNSLGLLGHGDTGEMIGRDGVTIIEDVNEFGQEWQVRVGEEPMMFHNVEGPQYPDHCEKAHKDEALLKRRLSSPENRRLGQEACAMVEEEDFEDCVFDVIVTNDIEIAGAYSD